VPANTRTRAGECPRCLCLIWSDHDRATCKACGRHLPMTIRERLDKEPRDAEVSRTSVATDLRSSGGALVFAVLGALAGFVIAFLLRPSVPILGQLPVEMVITRGATLSGLGEMARPLAEQSFNLVVAGTLLGAIIGYVLFSIFRSQPAGLPSSTRGSSAAQVRHERACPWCAETILAAAKICKHCQREV
jgi:hypothetical protein